MKTPNPPTDYGGKPSIPGLGPIVDMEEKKKLSKKQQYIAKQAQPEDKITGADFKKLRSMKKEGGDHEVAMAQSSLQAIIEAAQELMAKLGSEERNIPGWIQDHITNAENYIEQAAQGFHEVHPEEDDSMSLTKLMEEIKDNPQMSSDVKAYAKNQASSTALKSSAKKINTATKLGDAFQEWIKILGFTPETLTIGKALPVFKKALEDLNFK
jgi:sialic acid synthase SpsE